MFFTKKEPSPNNQAGRLIKTITTAALLLFTLAGYSQQSNSAQVQGNVTDAGGEGLPGVNIHLKGTNIGTTTDAKGGFSIEAEPNAILVVSYIGYTTQEIKPGNKGQLSVTLTADQRQLNEVVVVGYGTQERKNLIGSITKVDPTDVKNIPAGSFDAQLQGKVPGVQITSNTGVPGEAVTVRVRGATSINGDNDPLYVIDGVFMNSNSMQTIGTGGKATSPIADINPNDIESLEVLRDAEATALYGSRGANGVILITTKRGKYNQKAKVSLNASYGLAKAEKLWELTTGPEHAQLVNEWWINTGKDTPSLNRTEANRPFRPASEGGRGLPEEQKTYDRLGEIFQTAPVQNYDLSVSGGTATTKYYIGGGYNSQESILKPINFNRASFKVNLDQKISDKVQIGVSNSFARTFRNQARAGDGPAGGLLQAALHTPTYLSPTNENGELVGRAGFDNVTLLLQHYDVKSVSLRYIGNLYAEADILPNLKFRTSWGLDYNNYDENEYWNTFLISGSPNGLATANNGQATTWINEQTLTYRHKIGTKHSFGILIGNTIQSDLNTGTTSTGRGFANNAFKLISSAATTTGSNSWSKKNLASFFSRIDYNYGGKYLIDFSIRADGSSSFGADRRWGYFPSVGGAWRVKQENFLKNVAVLSDLKIRASYGVTGNQNGLGSFAALGLWGSGSPYQGNPGIAPQQLANPDLQWERTNQFNAGADIAFFGDRLGIEVNVYRKYTSNGLLSLTLPATTGFANYRSNTAEISNKGFELAIRSVNVQNSTFSWTTSFNVARNINKIEKLENPLEYGSRSLILLQQGQPLYSFWVYKQLYVDPQTGNTVYEDVNKDGKITVADRQIDGSIWPKFFGGLTNSITYKGFDVNAFLAFQYGNKVYNHNKFFGEGGGARDAARIIFASNNDRWQKPGDITDVPRPDGVNVNNYRDGGSRWLEDGSFIRLRSLAIGYTIPVRGISSLRLYVTGTNLFTITKYTGLDPESSSSSVQNEQGIDLGTPPQPRSVLVGVNLTF
ncbi:TonB-dependent receptor [Dyadobacter sp. CY347]|uniref:SusC/RagA family TonB-linked outer membrane protein n=1 Tax=Dyadobacter sp. CY347 TaxID=2909336 RepID=UPI001F307CE1|nr:TonB-dependent receptor [Dyadobacter sp. CY347]MCF2489307.1 TonB-dependent receptor [Dyadobacter sp. CY347]